MIKNLFYLILVMVLPLVSFSQKKGIYVSANVSGSTAIAIKENLSDAGIQLTTGSLTSVLLNAGYMFTDRVGVFAGMGTEGLNFSLEGKDADKDRRFIYDYEYITVPMFVRFHTANTKVLNYFANVGVKMSFLSGANVKYYDLYPHEMYKTDYSYYTNSLFVSPYISAGIDVPVGKRVGVDIGADWQMALTNVFTKASKIKYYPMPVGLRVGLNVRLSN